MSTNKPVKKRFIFIAILCAFSSFVHGQEAALQNKIKIVQDLLNPVEAHKLDYEQNLRTISPGYYEFSKKIIDEKGKEKEIVCTFSLADINKSSIRSYTKKDVILIEMVVNQKERLIKKVTNEGEKISYDDSFTMTGLNADNGRDLVKALKEAVPVAVEIDEKSLNLGSFENHVNWLKENITDVALPKKAINQKITITDLNLGLINLSQTEDSKKDGFNFNLALLNKQSVKYKVSGSDFLIIVETKKSEPGIKHMENGSLEGYKDEVSFYANSLINGKNIFKVLKKSIPLAEESLENNKPKTNSTSSAVSLLNKYISDVKEGEAVISQKLEVNGNMADFTVNIEENGKSSAHNYYVSFMDLSKSGIDLDSKKDKLFLKLPAANGKKFIAHSEGGEKQNYEKYFTLYFNSMTDAIIAKDAIEYLIEEFKNDEDNDSGSDYSLTQALSLLQKELKKVQTDDETYEQSIDMKTSEKDNYRISVIFSNSKKSVETIYEFNVSDINKRKVLVKVSGKRVLVELSTKGGEKVIKNYEEGKVENYTNKIEIEALDIENAKKIVSIFRRINSDN